VKHIAGKRLLSEVAAAGFGYMDHATSFRKVMMPADVKDSAVAKAIAASVCRLSHARFFMERNPSCYIWLRLLPATMES